MTLHVQTTVVCDGPADGSGALGCGAYMEGTVTLAKLPSREKIRAKARFMGWVVRRAGRRDLDLCPKHAHLEPRALPDGTVELLEAVADAG